MPVPFADLQLQYQNIRREIDGAIAGVIRDNAFIRGHPMSMASNASLPQQRR